LYEFILILDLRSVCLPCTLFNWFVYITGAANIAGSFVSAYPVTGSFSR